MKTALQLMKERIDQAKAKQALKPKTKNQFEIAEEKGRKMFHSWTRSKGLEDADFSTDSSCAYDATLEGNYYEIKYKEKHKYEQYQYLIEREGLFIEELKFNRLKSVWQKDTTKEFYYWLAFEDFTLIFKIDFNTEYEYKIHQARKTTVGTSDEYVDKKFLLIPLDKTNLIPTIK